MEEIEIIYKCFQTASHMMMDRGYMIMNPYHPEGNTKISLSDFVPIYEGYRNSNQSLNIVCHHKTESIVANVSINLPNRVLSTGDLKVQKTAIDKALAPYVGDRTVHYVYISKDEPNNHVLKSTSGSNDTEFFSYKKMAIRVIDHQLVPKHDLLTPAEKAEVMKIFRLKDSDFPKMSSSDPVARYYGAKSGQVFKIHRYDGISYRIVV